MQEITFAKGNEQQLKDCRDALCRSTLGERYFSSPGSAENAILEGIRQGNLYVALIGEECVGFTYIIPKGAFHSFPYLHIIAVKEEAFSRHFIKVWQTSLHASEFWSVLRCCSSLCILYRLVYCT